MKDCNMFSQPLYYWMLEVTLMISFFCLLNKPLKSSESEYLERLMRMYMLILSLILVIGLGATYGSVCDRTNRLFVIERNKNGNAVQYDVCLNDNSDLADVNPVKAYWVLENGQQKSLNSMERKYAYGIHSQEKLGKNRFAISLAALKDRKIVVEMIGGRYKALVPIDGEPSILQRVYVQAEEMWVGLPRVDYVDLFGLTAQAKTPVRERVVP